MYDFGWIIEDLVKESFSLEFYCVVSVFYKFVYIIIYYYVCFKKVEIFIEIVGEVGYYVRYYFREELDDVLY